MKQWNVSIKAPFSHSLSILGHNCAFLQISKTRRFSDESCAPRSTVETRHDVDRRKTKHAPADDATPRHAPVLYHDEITVLRHTRPCRAPQTTRLSWWFLSCLFVCLFDSPHSLTHYYYYSSLTHDETYIIVLGITITKADTTVEDGMASASTAILEHFMLMIRL
jgi:hypothetical protein